MMRPHCRSFGATHADALSHIGEPGFVGQSTGRTSPPAAGTPPATGTPHTEYAQHHPQVHFSGADSGPISPRPSSIAVEPPTPARVFSPLDSSAMASTASHFSTPAATPPARPASEAAALNAAPTGSFSSGSGIARMATTDRRRLQHSEQEIGVGEGEGGAPGDTLPQYELMPEELSVEERERREAELIEAQRREAKQAGG